MKRRVGVILVAGAIFVMIFIVYRSSQRTVEISSRESETMVSTSRGNTADQSHGSLEIFTYTTNFEGQLFEKEAQVYLPPNYLENANQRYNILYLLHGYSMDYDQFLSDRETGEPSGIKELLDTLILDETIDPLIVVSPTYYPNRSLIPDTWREDDPLNLRFATEELPNDLMPAVESTYRTYAETTGVEDLEDSREHRAFGGFSMGAITTWYVFEHQLQLFSEFLPMAGDSWTIAPNGGAGFPEETATALAQSIEEANLEDKTFRIQATVGSSDSTHYQMDTMIAAMQEQDIFTEENLSYTLDPQGGHDLDSVTNQLAATLPQLFN